MKVGYQCKVQVTGLPDGANLRTYCAIQYPAECVALGFAGNGSMVLRIRRIVGPPHSVDKHCRPIRHDDIRGVPAPRADVMNVEIPWSPGRQKLVGFLAIRVAY